MNLEEQAKMLASLGIVKPTVLIDRRKAIGNLGRVHDGFAVSGGGASIPTP